MNTANVVGSPPPGDPPSDPALRLLVDRAQISDVIMRYAAAVDRRDWELLETCFVPDLKVVGWGQREFADRHELLEYIKGVAHFHTTMHMMGNQFIEVDGDRASLESYAMLTHHGRDADGQPTELNRSGALYKEKLSRTPGGWIISQRGGEPEWAPTGVTAVHSHDPKVGRLLARAEIHDLLMSYALGIDHRDYARIGSCFASDLLASYGAHVFTDLPTLLQFISGVETFDSTTHFLGQQITDFEGNGAFALTYSMITHRPKGEDESAEWTVGGPSYRDRLVRENERWKIANRGDSVAWSPARHSLATPSPDPIVQWLLDRADIAQLIATVAFATDSEDRELLETCFTPHFELLDENGSVIDRGLFVTASGKPTPAAQQTCHFLGNQLIELMGNEARTETYAYVTRRDRSGDPLSPWSRGPRRFVDELVRVDDQWYIAKRQIKTNRVKE